MENIGDRIKVLRKKIGMTQEDLGRKLHVRKQTVYKWEKGINIPDAYVINLLSTILNCTADFLVGRTDNPSEGIIENDDIIIKIDRKVYPYDLTPEQVDKLINTLRSYNFNIDNIIKAIKDNEIDKDL